MPFQSGIPSFDHAVHAAEERCRSALPTVVDELAAYDAEHLLTSLAALQLVPQNADCQFRLETACFAIIAGPMRRGQHIISVKRLQNLLTTQPFQGGDISSLEDPADGVFAEEIAFHGGTFTVFPGRFAEGAHSLATLLKAIFLHPDSADLRASVPNLSRMALSALTLSQLVAARAGITRKTTAIGGRRKQLHFPEKIQMARLRGAVNFDAEDLNYELSKSGGSVEDLLDLIASTDSPDLSSFGCADHVLLRRPLVRIGSQIVVALPSGVTSGLFSALLEGAMGTSFSPALSLACHDLAVMSVIESLERLRCFSVCLPVPDMRAGRCITELLVQFDTDKVAYCPILSDPFPDNAAHRNEYWHLSDVADWLAGRGREIAVRLTDSYPAPNALLVLPIIHAVGRNFVGDFTELSEAMQSPLVGLTTEQLHALSLLEHFDVLTLWKFGVARERVHSSRQVLEFGIFDALATFLHNDQSFHASGNRMAPLVLEPGAPGLIRQELKLRHDFHSVPIPPDGAYVEVIQLFGDGESPIYGVLTERGSRSSVLVEGQALPIWIIGAPVNSDAPDRIAPQPPIFADAVAFVMWRLAPLIASSLERICRVAPWIAIHVVLPDGRDWHLSQPLDGLSPLFHVNVDATSSSIILKIGPGIAKLIDRPDNAAERALIEPIIDGIESLDRVFSPSCSVTIDRHAAINLIPVSRGKMLCALHPGRDSRLDPRGKGTWRPVQRYDQNIILDEIGEFLLKRMSPGVLDPRAQGEVFKAVVAFLFEKFSKEIDALMPDNFLASLMSQYEALIHDDAVHRLNIPARIEAFGLNSWTGFQFFDNLNRHAEALTTLRFIIEFVAARPPRGNRPPSYSVMDRLMALAFQIFRIGTEADIVHFRLASFECTLDDSGRLTRDSATYNRAMQTYQPQLVVGQLHLAKSQFDVHWEINDVNSSDCGFPSEANEAAMAEFGISFASLASAVTALLNCPEAEAGGIVEIDMGRGESLIASALGSLEDARTAIQLLSLQPRESFLDPQGGLRSFDVYPWRYNRALCYLRRPLVIRETDSQRRILFGVRHLPFALEFLVRLCTEGRLRATSQRMRALISKIRNEDAEAFNDQVADVFQRHPKYLVQRRVSKVGHLRGNRGPVGDIDVLVFDRKRRLAYVIECKDFAIARTPAELSNELEGLFLDRNGSKSTVAKHMARIEWTRKNIHSLLRHFQLPTAGTWKIEGIIVTSGPLLSPLLSKSPIQVVTLEELQQQDILDPA